jgi:hypothetical protein
VQDGIGDRLQQLDALLSAGEVGLVALVRGEPELERLLRLEDVPPIVPVVPQELRTEHGQAHDAPGLHRRHRWTGSAAGYQDLPHRSLKQLNPHKRP